MRDSKKNILNIFIIQYLLLSESLYIINILENYIHFHNFQIFLRKRIKAPIYLKIMTIYTIFLFFFLLYWDYQNPLEKYKINRFELNNF